MNKKRRFTFKCWSCNRKYTLLREITEEQELFVACPYCDKEAVVKLKPFEKDIKSTMRGDREEESLGVEYDLPEVLPTEEITESN